MVGLSDSISRTYRLTTVIVHVMRGVRGKGLAESLNERNLFGVEWVLPAGNGAQWLGSPGTGAGWFTADGPGPSLRGIMRGSVGALGGNGIFTRIGFKLYSWPGGELKSKTQASIPRSA